ncbi:MAG: hypothetical protein ACRDLD_10145 [Thermoleophilaceae bacterium]
MSASRSHTEIPSTGRKAAQRVPAAQHGDLERQQGQQRDGRRDVERGVVLAAEIADAHERHHHDTTTIASPTARYAEDAGRAAGKGGRSFP